jgi:hypothetical protein
MTVALSLEDMAGHWGVGETIFWGKECTYRPTPGKGMSVLLLDVKEVLMTPALDLK